MERTDPSIESMPPELESRLRRSNPARVAWHALAPSHRREWIRAIEDATKPQTRERLADRAIATLTESP
jgi:uncharacterized protein YdeI (YjbR/CyaY-like superfamily)